MRLKAGVLAAFLVGLVAGGGTVWTIGENLPPKQMSYTERTASSEDLLAGVNFIGWCDQFTDQAVKLDCIDSHDNQIQWLRELRPAPSAVRYCVRSVMKEKGKNAYSTDLTRCILEDARKKWEWLAHNRP
jgi:hypothetical protein